LIDRLRLATSSICLLALVASAGCAKPPIANIELEAPPFLTEAEQAELSAIRGWELEKYVGRCESYGLYIEALRGDD